MTHFMKKCQTPLLASDQMKGSAMTLCTECNTNPAYLSVYAQVPDTLCSFCRYKRDMRMLKNRVGPYKLHRYSFWG
jgi:hypothetical protein